MSSVFSSSPPGNPRSRTTAFNMARPAYMPAHIPAGPAPTITTSYSNVAANFRSLRQRLESRAGLRQFITAVQCGRSKSDPDVPAAVDDDRLAGDVVRLE